MLKSIVLALALVAPMGFGATKTYQVTGPVLDVTDTLIVVQKGNEKWEIEKGTVATDVKKGDKVTVEYAMTAKTVKKK